MRTHRPRAAGLPRPAAGPPPRRLLARWSRRAAAAAGTGLLLMPAGAHAAARIAPDQTVATMLSAHTVRRAPQAGARTVATVAARRPITGQRTVLPVIAQTVDRGGRFWLRVRLPGRTRSSRPPRSGWISASSTRLSSTAWHIVVNRRARRVLVYEGGRKTRSIAAIVGKPSTPTPRGEYFVEETMSLPSTSSGAPFALALSARSDVLQEFEGGPGQIALHGVDNVGGQLGTAVSHGCVRMSTGDVTWLATTIGPGDPVSIV